MKILLLFLLIGSLSGMAHLGARHALGARRGTDREATPA
jgi:hypothetical protein